MTPGPRMSALLVASDGGTRCVSVACRAAPPTIAFLDRLYALTAELTKGGWPVYQERRP